MPVSAVHGLQSGDLLDAIVAKLPPETRRGDDEDDGVVRLAIIGQPNVGKSSLVNALLGKQRAIVSAERRARRATRPIPRSNVTVAGSSSSTPPASADT